MNDDPLNLREAVDGHDDLDAELARVLDVLRQVLAALPESHEVLLGVRLVQRLSGRHVWSTAVHLQCASRRDNDNGVRLQAAGAALDVAELLEAVPRRLASTSIPSIAMTIRQCRTQCLRRSRPR